jgi:hypothetical protein
MGRVNAMEMSATMRWPALRRKIVFHLPIFVLQQTDDQNQEYVSQLSNFVFGMTAASMET